MFSRFREPCYNKLPLKAAVFSNRMPRRMLSPPRVKALKSTHRPPHLRKISTCSDDGESSTYSIDTDGYYTSMHTDSGIPHQIPEELVEVSAQSIEEKLSNEDRASHWPERTVSLPARVAKFEFYSRPHRNRSRCLVQDRSWPVAPLRVLLTLPV